LLSLFLGKTSDTPNKFRNLPMFPIPKHQPHTPCVVFILSAAVCALCNCVQHQQAATAAASRIMACAAYPYMHAMMMHKAPPCRYCCLQLHNC